MENIDIILTRSYFDQLLYETQELLKVSNIIMCLLCAKYQWKGLPDKMQLKETTSNNTVFKPRQSVTEKDEK